MPETVSGEWSPLVDLSDRRMLDVIQGGDDALARAARRVIRALDDPDGIISAFQSFTSS
ncbi:hypothetical protein HDA40_007340 [Hamadaea flava]|uniref:FXSXX-COOH protein n=1 Tax=Hamadaea flava TaxID=1742688 RepID=A0ABV8LVC2_9ACTN|nr:hypothetical protein [Hamadaea flava]MCP2328833.1 hypothetical protein [Hamadaea flava]